MRKATIILMKHSPYRSLGLTVGIHFFIMYALTYAALNSFDDEFLNVNRFYMAVIMVSPMVILMILSMHSMYENSTVNITLLSGAALLFILGFTFIRQQTLVGDVQFLLSMIPHHSSAIVMCEHSQIEDPEIIELCGEIVEAQQREIDQMNDILNRISS